jgi:hypothetical protein
VGYVDPMSTVNRQLDPSADKHAPPAAVRLHSTDGSSNGGPGRAIYEPADVIETACGLCVLEFRDGRFQHSRSCPLRAK